MILWEPTLRHSITGRGVVRAIRSAEKERSRFNLASWLEHVYDLFLGRESK